MLYLENADDIEDAIAQYSQAKILWIDTEVADFRSRNPQLSLIQILDDGTCTEENVTIFDVLTQPEVTDILINQIIVNPAIEKVFHNAKFDLKFLGKSKAKNVTCTLEIAKKIPYYLLPLPDLSLKTLAAALCNFNVDKTEQTSDWGQRPLSDRQLNYATMDPVYLAMIHQKLLQLQAFSNPHPEIEDLSALAQRYLELKQQLQILESEVTHYETRLKAAMQVQNLQEINNLKLLQAKRSTAKVAFSALAKVAELHKMQLEFPITLTQKLQKELNEIIDELPLEIETSVSWQLKVQQEDTE